MKCPTCNKNEAIMHKLYGATACSSCLERREREIEEKAIESYNRKMSFMSEDARAAHWKDIQSRVTTHEGEFLHGRRGQEYQQKWSKQYLGRDLSQARHADRWMVDAYKSQKK